MAGAVHGFHRHRVLFSQRLFQGLALERGTVQRVGHHAAPAPGNLLADIGGHALLTGEGFQAAPLAAVAQRSFRIQHHVAVFRGFEQVAGKQLAVQDQAAAHAGAHEEAHHVFVSLHGPVLVFAQHAHVHVVSDVEGHAEFLLDGRFDIVIPPGQVGGKQHDALLLIDHARRASSDSFCVFGFHAGFLDHLPHHADDDLFNVFRRFAAGFGLLFEPVDGLSRLVENSAEHFGSANVQTNAVIRCHVNTSPVLVFRFAFC